MIPGPVETPQNILDAIGAPTMPHYGPEFLAMLTDTVDMGRRLFETKNDVLLMPGPGTGALGALIGAAGKDGDGAIVIDNGFFADRAADIATGHGLTPYIVEFPWGEVVDPEVVRNFIKETLPKAAADGHPITQIIVIHHETSTGVLNPLKEISAVSNEFNIPLIVDAVASGGGVPTPLDAWGIDGFVTVGNKCIATPPGLGIAAVSPRLWQIAKANPSPRGWYYDLKIWAHYVEEWAWHPFPTTMPSNNIKGLNQALKDIFAIGPAAHYAKIAAAAAYLRAGMAEMGFTLFPKTEAAAPMVTAFNGLPGLDIGAMISYLNDECRIIISGGLVSLRGKIFRVGHMGGASEKPLMDEFLAGVRDFLA